MSHGPHTYVEDLETSNIQHTDELLTLLLGVECLVTLLHQPLEQPIEHSLAQGSDGVGDLVLVTALGNELVTDLNPGLQQVLVQLVAVSAAQLGHTGTLLDTVSLSLLLATPLLELHASHVHDSGGDLVDVVLLLLGEAQHVESLLCRVEGDGVSQKTRLVSSFLKWRRHLSNRVKHVKRTLKHAHTHWTNSLGTNPQGVMNNFHAVLD